MEPSSPQVGLERRLFDQRPHSRQQVLWVFAQWLTKKPHLAHRWLNQIEQHTDGGRFACSIGAEKAKYLAPRHFQVQPLNGQSLPVSLRQSLCLQHNLL